MCTDSGGLAGPWGALLSQVTAKPQMQGPFQIPPAEKSFFSGSFFWWRMYVFSPAEWQVSREKEPGLAYPSISDAFLWEMRVDGDSESNHLSIWKGLLSILVNNGMPFPDQFHSCDCGQC